MCVRLRRKYLTEYALHILQKRIVRLITGNNIHFDPDRAHLHIIPLYFMKQESLRYMTYI